VEKLQAKIFKILKHEKNNKINWTFKIFLTPKRFVLRYEKFDLHVEGNLL